MLVIFAYIVDGARHDLKSGDLLKPASKKCACFIGARVLLIKKTSAFYVHGA